MIHIYLCLSQFEHIFAGVDLLKKCYKNIKRHFCGEDEEKWRESCRSAFEERHVRVLEEKDWMLSELDTDDFEL